MTQVSRKNPFRPGVGLQPPYLAGRDASLRRFAAMLRAAPEQPANMCLTGLRGVGKTVLLQEFERRAREQNWATSYLEFMQGHNTDAGLVGAIEAQAQKVRLEVSRMERVKAAVGAAIRSAGRLGVTYNEVTLSFASDVGTSVDRNLTKTLYELCEFVVDKGMTGVALLLDESQTIRDEKEPRGSHPLSILISTIVALQKKEIPIGLVLCGLPTLKGNLLRARSYTERMFRGEPIGALEQNEARQALIEPLKEGVIKANDAVVGRIVDEVEGYPFFVQLWGAELWDAADHANVDLITEEILSATEKEIYRRVDQDFYEPRITTLTPAEQDLLLATAKTPTYPPLLVAEVKDVIDKSPGNINVLLGRMVDQGVLYRLRKSQYEYTAPKFRDYLQRRVSRDT